LTVAKERKPIEFRQRWHERDGQWFFTPAAR
jgi:hypothetical protein